MGWVSEMVGGYTIYGTYLGATYISHALGEGGGARQSELISLYRLFASIYITDGHHYTHAGRGNASAMHALHAKFYSIRPPTNT